MELDKLRTIIAEVLCVDPKEITVDTTFIDDLCADSLDVFQIVMGIEEEFGIEISSADAERISTVGEAVELIKTAIKRLETSATLKNMWKKPVAGKPGQGFLIVERTL